MRYLVGGIEVEAVKSVGGGFYELTVVKTGEKQRYIAEVFESVVMMLGSCKTHNTPHPRNRDCKDWNQV
jgi:hypothetical protein